MLKPLKKSDFGIHSKLESYAYLLTFSVGLISAITWKSGSAPVAAEEFVLEAEPLEAAAAAAAAAAAIAAAAAAEAPFLATVPDPEAAVRVWSCLGETRWVYVPTGVTYLYVTR